MAIFSSYWKLQFFLKKLQETTYSKIDVLHKSEVIQLRLLKQSCFFVPNWNIWIWPKWNGKGRTAAFDDFKWDFTLISEILQRVLDLFSLAILRALLY